MRRLLFRGKDIKTNEWIYGAYYPAYKEKDGDDWPDIIYDYNNSHLPKIVNPETVGQFWKQGKHEFFGGDLFITECSPSGSSNRKKRLCMVEDCDDGMQIVVWYKQEWWHYNYLSMLNIERVGNIYDNSELLKQ